MNARVKNSNPMPKVETITMLMLSGSDTPGTNPNIAICSVKSMNRELNQERTPQL